MMGKVVVDGRRGRLPKRAKGLSIVQKKDALVAQLKVVAASCSESVRLVRFGPNFALAL